jgi:hypothetical protein
MGPPPLFSGGPRGAARVRSTLTGRTSTPKVEIQQSSTHAAAHARLEEFVRATVSADLDELHARVEAIEQQLAATPSAFAYREHFGRGPTYQEPRRQIAI